MAIDALYLIVGALVIGVGGVFSTWGIDRLKERSAIRGWAIIAFGALIIGAGSYVTGQGLDRRAVRLQKQALIIAVAQEWELNDFEFKNSGLLQGDSLELWSIGALYPRFSRDAAIAALSSGQFDAKRPEDSVFLFMTTELARRIRDVNARLDLSDGLITEGLPIEVLVQHRKVVLESVRLKWFLNIHRFADSLLSASYPWLRSYRSLAVRSE